MKVGAAERNDFKWLAARAHCVLTSDFKAIKAERDDEIVGMVGYCNWTPTACEAHIAVTSPFAWKYLIPAVFEYPFIEGGRELIVGVTTSDHIRSMRLIEHLGFRQTYRIRDGWSEGIDKVIFELRKKDCGWIQGKKAA